MYLFSEKENSKERSKLGQAGVWKACLIYKERERGGASGKELTCQTGDLGSIPGLGRSSGEGNGDPLQYSCLENSMDRGAWWAIVHGVAQSWT